MQGNESDATGLGPALRRLFARGPAGAMPPLETMSAPAFRALVAERLRTLERDLAELRGRINGLLFVVAGAVVTQVLLRLFA
jgi:hypothetical protein